MKLPTDEFVIRLIAVTFCVIMIAITAYAVLSVEGLSDQGGEYYAALLASMLTFIITHFKSIRKKKKDLFD